MASRNDFDHNVVRPFAFFRAGIRADPSTANRPILEFEGVYKYFRRDMPTLVATLAALDRHSLATQRAVTVPMLRDWLQRDRLSE